MMMINKYEKFNEFDRKTNQFEMADFLIEASKISPFEF